MQRELLSKYPSQPLKVYMVWQPIHRSDTPESAELAARQLFNDTRVVQFWDGKNEIGAWYKQEGSLEISTYIMWDAYYLYAAEARWDGKPDHLIGTGHPVSDTYKTLIQTIRTEWTGRHPDETPD